MNEIATRVVHRWPTSKKIAGCSGDNTIGKRVGKVDDFFNQVINMIV